MLQPSAASACFGLPCAARARWVALLTVTLMFGAALPAQAQWDIPAGASVDMAGGSADLACTDLLVGGMLVVGAGGSVTGVRDVRIAPGGSLVLDGGTLQLSQQWVNQGSFSAGGGQVTRAAGPDCPAVGPLGPFNPLAPATPVAVPTTSPAGLAVLACLLAALGWRSRRRAGVAPIPSSHR